MPRHHLGQLPNYDVVVISSGVGGYRIAHDWRAGKRTHRRGLPVDWIVADIVRLENGKLAEHWDVIQDEAKKESSASGLPTFGDKFPA